MRFIAQFKIYSGLGNLVFMTTRGYQWQTLSSGGSYETGLGFFEAEAPTAADAKRIMADLMQTGQFLFVEPEEQYQTYGAPIVMDPFVVTEDRIPTGPSRTLLFLLAIVLLATLANGCASRVNAPEAPLSREARARWTAQQARELNAATRGITFPPTAKPTAP